MKALSGYMHVGILMCFLSTSCFSNELFEKVCNETYDLCLKKCEREHKYCMIPSQTEESEKYCDNEYKTEDSPCITKCNQVKEDCYNKTKDV